MHFISSQQEIEFSKKIENIQVKTHHLRYSSIYTQTNSEDDPETDATANSYFSHSTSHERDKTAKRDNTSHHYIHRSLIFMHA